jgi:hypothetical protein
MKTEEPKGECCILPKIAVPMKQKYICTNCGRIYLIGAADDGRYAWFRAFPYDWNHKPLPYMEEGSYLVRSQTPANDDRYSSPEIPA